MFEKGAATDVAKSEKKGKKDLQKTKMCSFFLEGKCTYGTDCTFAHSAIEVRAGPDLRKTSLCAKFAAGKCNDANCSYAHGEAELRDPPNFKKKFCKWYHQGKCRNGTNCGFVHDVAELRGDLPPGLEIRRLRESPAFPAQKLRELSGPPGLAKADIDDCDASTDVPSEKADNDVGTGIPAIPEERLFRLQAGRGAAPLQQQVDSMKAAITGLQEKLAKLEHVMIESQVNQMQTTIRQLTQQCENLTMQQKLVPPAPATPWRLNPKAVPFKPFNPNDCKSDDSTSVGSD
jgi:hypothetical protein